jgi:hypothetical protein
VLLVPVYTFHPDGRSRAYAMGRAGITTSGLLAGNVLL